MWSPPRPRPRWRTIAATLAEKRIGAVVVMEKDAIRGIVSERDIVRAVARHGGDGAERCRVADWMTAQVS